MAIESAREYVKKFFEDDEFLKKLYERGVVGAGKDFTGEDFNRKAAEDAKEMGYDFTAEEFETASHEYGESIGKWKSVKKVFHIAKVVSKAEKENKKKNKNE